MNGTSLDGTVWLTWMSWVEEPGTTCCITMTSTVSLAFPYNNPSCWGNILQLCHILASLIINITFSQELQWFTTSFSS